MKITPAHDRLDYNIAQKHSLPIIGVIDEDGNMTDACKEFKVWLRTQSLFISY